MIDAGEHPPQRHVEVLPQQVAGVAAHPVVGGGDVEERAPHRAGVRHEGLVPDTAGGDELPHDEEHDQGQQRQSGPGQPPAPLAGRHDTGRQVELRLVGGDVDENGHRVLLPTYGRQLKVCAQRERNSLPATYQVGPVK